MGGGGVVGGHGINKKNLSERRRDEPDQVMGHSWLKICRNKSKFSAQDIIQHHEVVLPHTTIYWSAKSPLRCLTACKVHHRAWEKQPAKADHSNLGDFVGDI